LSVTCRESPKHQRLSLSEAISLNRNGKTNALKTRLAFHSRQFQANVTRCKFVRCHSLGISSERALRWTERANVEVNASRGRNFQSFTTSEIKIAAKLSRFRYFRPRIIQFKRGSFHGSPLSSQIIPGQIFRRDERQRRRKRTERESRSEFGRDAA